MTKLKFFLPLILPAIIFIWGFISFVTAKPGIFDGLGYGLMFFYILMPMAAFVSSVIYGIIWPGLVKWVMVPFFGLIELFFLTVCTGDWDPGYYSVMMLLTAVPSAFGIVVGSRFAAHRAARREVLPSSKPAPSAPAIPTSTDNVSSDSAAVEKDSSEK